MNGELPDSKCTPGVTDSAVTQANIQQTICKAGYGSGIRNKFAPVSYTDGVKRQQIRAYGYTDTTKKVCARQMTLQEAQQIISTDRRVRGYVTARRTFLDE